MKSGIPLPLFATDQFMTNIITKVQQFLIKNNLVLVTTESCTGGWVAKLMTDRAGSSAYFDRGFVTYSNQSKQDMLGVREKTLEEHGAVSEPVVKEMVQGALQHSSADIAIAISGIAGPSGGSKEKPVGTVCFAWMLKGFSAEAETCLFSGNRENIREKSVEYALNGIIEKIGAKI